MNPSFANAAPPADLLALLPFGVVGISALIVLFFDLIVPKRAARASSLIISLIALIVTGIILATQYAHHETRSAFGGAFLLGGFSVVFSEIIVVATILSLLLTAGIGTDDQVGGAVALTLWSASGAMLMAGAGNLMTIFLGLELLSLALYCLCAISLRPIARESALKYLLLSSMASAFLLYGMALLFGATGSVALAALVTVHPSFLVALGFGLFFVGLAFKLSLVPFHMWTPDVYEGAPLAVTAFMSVVTKAGVLAVLIRVAYAAMPPGTESSLLYPLWILAALSMFVGNLAALAQTDMKRLLAYSGIAQLGYIVAALAGTTTDGLRYAIFYFAAYMFMNLGAFAVVALVTRDPEGGTGLASFAGLGYRRPFLAGAMTFFLLALAGLPPTAGFTGKILLLASTAGAGYVWLGAFLILGTAISIYVYIKIVRAMYARADLAHVPVERSATVLPWIGVALCAVLVLVMGFFPLTPSNVVPFVK